MSASTDPDARPSRIVLYVDDSEHWHAAARLLGEFARAAGSHVVVASSALLSSRRQRALDRAKELLRLPEGQLELIGRAGLLEYTLPDVARETDADVVIVGRLGSADRLTSGLIAHLVAKRTPASVLVARGRPTGVRKILMCTEGARHGLLDFEIAARVAKAFGARLDVLHVANLVALTDKGSEEIEDDLKDFLHSDAAEAEHLRELETRLREIGLEGAILVRAGLVVEEIVDAVREGGYDLLVIGAHEIGGPGAHLYEDFASLILRASPASTLVVRERLRAP